MSTSTAIIGGGLVGLTTAFFLTEAGAEVTVVDHGALGGGAARGNAGFMCATMITPLAGPGAITSALRSFRDPLRALRVHPAQVPRMAPWFLRFALASTAKQHHAGSAALVDLNRGLRESLAQLVTGGVDVTLGNEILVPFHDEALATKFANEMSGLAALLELPAMTMLDAVGLRALVPALTDYVRAGFVMSGDRAADPRAYVDSLIDVLRRRGVRMIENAPIERFESANGRVLRAHTRQGAVDASEFVLSAGAGVQQLGRMLDLRIPVVAGQGYNVALPTTAALDRPVIFEEAHAVATPFGDRIRLGGTMEFGGNNPRFDARRVDAIIGSMKRFLHLEWDERTDTWAGSRPMSPDGLALLGRVKGWSNLTLAGGHGMYGLSLSPTSGRAIAELLVDGKASIDLRPFDPNRFRL